MSTEPLTLPPLAQAAYDRLRERIQQRLLNDRQTLQYALDELQAAGPKWADHDRIRSLAHQLAGLGGSFGHDDVSATAMQLEAVLEASVRPQHDIEAAMRALLRALGRACGLPHC